MHTGAKKVNTSSISKNISFNNVHNLIMYISLFNYTCELYPNTSDDRSNRNLVFHLRGKDEIFKVVKYSVLNGSIMKCRLLNNRFTF